MNWFLRALKWVAKNPWVWAVADKTKEHVIDPIYKKYIKPIFKKHGSKGDSD